MRIFSGIQPTGVPHLGNYIGALRNWVKLQRPGQLMTVLETSEKENFLKGYYEENKEHENAINSQEDQTQPRHRVFSSESPEILYSIVDLHSLTVPREPDKMRDNIFQMAAALLACGVDADKSILFQQSTIHQHAELAWLLSCTAPFAQMKRMNQWKAKKVEGAALGLFSYPVLMASDILLYRSTHVPIGHDQLQHLELTRDLCLKMNKAYNTKLVMPLPIINKSGARIMSLRNPAQKMSKSDSVKGSRIEITDTADQIKSKIQKAVTDSEPFISEDLMDRPGIRNLVGIYAAITDLDESKVIKKYLGVENFNKELKKDLIEALVELLAPIRDDYHRYYEQKPYLTHVLQNGNEKAGLLAERTIQTIHDKMGVLIE